MKVLKLKQKSKIHWQSFHPMAAIISIYVRTMLPSAYLKQRDILAQFKQYTTCSARHDGNYSRYAYVVLYMACQKPGGLLDINVLNLFSSHLNGIQLALQDQLEINLSVNTRNEINGALAYPKNFYLSANVGSLA